MHSIRSVFLSAFLATTSFAPRLHADDINLPQGNPGVTPAKGSWTVVDGHFAPRSADAPVLNLNFETGDLRDWLAYGEAWGQQPIQGDIDQNRIYGKGLHSLHTGDYWVGGFEKLQDGPTGTLVSLPFQVTHPWCSFLLGGGNHASTRVEIVEWSESVTAAADTPDNFPIVNFTGKVFYRISGKNQEAMLPVVVNLASIQGKQIFIRIIDEEDGGWGHVNFDDFRFHERRPRFRQTPLEAASTVEVAEQYPYENLPAEEAARVMQVPPGFKVQVGAAEPDVRQPIAMALDDRGRVWIAEAYAYPVRDEPGKGQDRILIFEDTDLDGTLDSRKVFVEGLNLVSGLEVGFGGVWVGAAPYLMFIPDKNGDDVPDEPGPESRVQSPEPDKSGSQNSSLALNARHSTLDFPQDVPPGAQVLLDGWHYEDTHETLNAFIWGPDGWLYGCHGVFTHSRVGKPGTPDDQRIPINAGIWRYHPTRHVFEVFAHGTSNPWGVDFDEYGNAFATACVIPHLYHIIPGGRYQRQAGEHFNPHTYDDIKTIARHRHFVGNQWNNNDRARSDDLGGGHAHAGAMIYLGGAWPKEYHGKLFMNNIHGNRLNVDELIPEGSGFAGDRSPDFLLTGDKWSQFLYMTYGPDGQVWIIDWYDGQQCHHRDEAIHDRSNGRIYRISYGDAKPVKVDLQKLSDVELLNLAVHSENEWYVRHARRILQERNASLSGERSPGWAYIRTSDDVRDRWPTFTEVERIRSKRLADLLFEELSGKSVETPDESPAVRAVFVQLAGTTCPTEQLVDLAKADPSPAVRLAIASILQKRQKEDRWTILEALTSHPEDADDHNLPYMYWYAMEPLADVDPQRALALAMAAGDNIPMLREFMIRRLGSKSPGEGENSGLELLVSGLSQTKDDAARMTFLRGIHGALKGRSNVPIPRLWPEVFTELTNPNRTSQIFDVYMHALGIGTLLGDQAAAKRLAEIAVDEAGPPDHRGTALSFLVEARAGSLPEVIGKLLAGASLRQPALRAAATLNDPAIAESILANYAALSPAEKTDARNTLASRASYATALLNAVSTNKIPKADLSADLVRQLNNLNDEAVTKLLGDVWGVVRESDVDRKALIAHYGEVVTATGPAGEPELGRAVFSKTCQQCHTLFGTGGKVGPDITGANRRDLTYLLSNILDPSAVMAKEYQPLVIALTDGRIITGIQKEATDATLTVQTANELLTIPRADIDEMKQSEKSMMPEDQLRPFSKHEVRSLVAYLQSTGQTPLAATPDNAGQFFNGKDLAGWRSSTDQIGLWSVENGELVGKTDGLKHNEFLINELAVGDFRLTVDVKLVNNAGNSGIQIRSVPLDGGEMKGYQADIGAGWWGKLYEEGGRALLWDKEAQIKSGDWNTYEIVAVGSRVQTFLNGVKSVDLTDSEGARRGQIAFQLHSGGATEVRFKNINLQLLNQLPPHAAIGSPPDKWPVSTGGAFDSSKITWKKTQLDDKFRSEGVAIADFDSDGLMDIAGGSQWYQRQVQHLGRFEGSVITVTDEVTWNRFALTDPLQEFDPKVYSNSFMNYGDDVDGDGDLDLIVVDFPGKQTWWFENNLGARSEEQGASEAGSSLDPRSSILASPWKRHEITPVTTNESPQYLDVDGDGKRELVCGIDRNHMAIVRPQTYPEAPWKLQPISFQGAPGTDRFSHGLGIGDVNGDGRNDVLITNGWWEGPEDDADPTRPWEFHEVDFGPACSQMYVHDFDGDGDNDVLSASAHDFGIWWHENGQGLRAEGQGQEANSQQPTTNSQLPSFTRHEIDKSFSETHAVVLADINGDGLPDFVTGKRWWSHAGHGPGGDQVPVLCWFELKRENGTATWVKHLIDEESGVGTSFEVADVNANGLLDIAISNKRGTFLFEQVREAAK